MKKVTIKNVQGDVLQNAFFESDIQMNEWIDMLSTSAPWGNPAYDEFIPAVKDENGIILQEDSTIHHEAEFTVEIEDISAQVAQDKINKGLELLWLAANDYQSARISGAAIGLLTIGVLGGKPKCLAVQGWIKEVWIEYYLRKAIALSGESASLDFSSCGQMPFTVPELMEEVYT